MGVRRAIRKQRLGTRPSQLGRVSPSPVRPRRLGRVCLATIVATLVLLVLGLMPAGAQAQAGAAPGGNAGGRPGAVFHVGAAQEPITPTSLAGIYLGGYGLGPVHPAQGVLRPIYAHAMAIRARNSTVVFAAIDVQGHFLGYQQGPYGFADIASAISKRFSIPTSNIVISSTHTHNGPDDLGIWGGVPTGYLAYVAHQTEAAIAKAIASERPARLAWGTENVTGLCGTFPNSPYPNNGGNQTAYPIDNQLRVLQARAVSDGQVISTMVNLSCHATVYGPLDEVSPDWPGATVSYLEHNEQHATGSYGYAGSQALVMAGAVGHTWPASVPPAFSGPSIQPNPGQDNNYPADHFGNAVARAAVDALASPHIVQDTVVAGAMRTVSVVPSNAPIFDQLLHTPGPEHLDRSISPPYEHGNVIVTRAGTLRVGNLAFFAVPGEAYPSLLDTLDQHVRSQAGFIFGLANDQLGYVLLPSDVAAAKACSPTDEFFFTLSLMFGQHVVAADQAAAMSDGFATGDPPPGTPNPGQMSQSSSCLA